MNGAGTGRSAGGEGVDRTLIREMLALSPTSRIARLAKEARFIMLIDRAREAGRRPPPTHRGSGAHQQ
jgi:hypothetical protein